MQTVNLIHNRQESTISAGQKRNISFSCYTPLQGESQNGAYHRDSESLCWIL